MHQILILKHTKFSLPYLLDDRRDLHEAVVSLAVVRLEGGGLGDRAVGGGGALRYVRVIGVKLA